MQLAYLTNFFPSLTETFIYREVLEIRRRGISVKTYSLRRPQSAWMSREAVKLSENTRYLLPVSLPTLFACHLKFFLLNPIRYVKAFLKMVTPPHKSAKDRMRSFLHFGEGVVLADRMLKDGISHVHAHYASQSTSVARVIHLLTKIPYSFTAHAHDIWHDQLLIPQKLDEAVFVATCSQFGRQCLIRQTAKDVSGKIHVVYHGLDINKFVPPESDAQRVRNLVLSVGSLGETKGFPDLIRSCAILRDSGFMVKCIILGEGSQRTELEDLIKVSGLEKQVELPGAVPQERIIEFYHSAWVFALPCIIVADGRQDGIPNVLMEAMATGLPVITTNTTAQPELIENEKHGLLIHPHSPAELACAIRRLCEDFDLRNRIITDARNKMLDTFDSCKTIEPLLNLLDRFVFRA